MSPSELNKMLFVNTQTLSFSRLDSTSCIWTGKMIPLFKSLSHSSNTARKTETHKMRMSTYFQKFKLRWLQR